GVGFGDIAHTGAGKCELGPVGIRFGVMNVVVVIAQVAIGAVAPTGAVGHTGTGVIDGGPGQRDHRVDGQRHRGAVHQRTTRTGHRDRVGAGRGRGRGRNA